MTLAPTAATSPTVAATEFADAMSTLASGVVLVTGRVADRPWGTTVTAFASVSAAPPTVLVSLLSRLASADAIAIARGFGVSILSRDQLDVAEYGAARGATKFLDSLIEPCDRASASPAIAGALAHLDCDLVETVDVADHTVFLGRVRAVRRRRHGAPLLYYGRGYGSFERNLRCVSS
jgi:flavin reductase (DIM6/NTAB) family NADH-FMN oxidoreductase RutF